MARVQDMEEGSEDVIVSQAAVAEAPDFFKVQERTYKERRDR